MTNVQKTGGVGGLPHDIYELFPYQRPLWHYLVATVVGVIGVVIFGYYLRKFLRRIKVPKVFAPPDPWDVLISDLLASEPKNTGADPVELRECFFIQSQLLRRGIELSTSIRATDLTLKELRTALKYRDASFNQMIEFLSRADMIKFADAPTTIDEAQTCYRAIEGWIRDLKPRPDIQTQNQTQYKSTTRPAQAKVEV